MKELEVEDVKSDDGYLDFECPECGSNNFSSDGINRVCQGDNYAESCDFKWKEEDDYKYMYLTKVISFKTDKEYQKAKSKYEFEDFYPNSDESSEDESFKNDDNSLLINIPEKEFTIIKTTKIDIDIKHYKYDLYKQIYVREYKLKDSTKEFHARIAYKSNSYLPDIEDPFSDHSISYLIATGDTFDDAVNSLTNGIKNAEEYDNHKDDCVICGIKIVDYPHMMIECECGGYHEFHEEHMESVESSESFSKETGKFIKCPLDKNKII